MPNGENAHITVRSPDWWKGVIDTVAIKYPDVKVLLICSQTFSKGVIFQPFKSKDWHSSSKYSTSYKTIDFNSNTITNLPASTPFANSTSLAQTQAIALCF